MVKRYAIYKDGKLWEYWYDKDRAIERAESRRGWCAKVEVFDMLTGRKVFYWAR
jgi:hypothetical protein